MDRLVQVKASLDEQALVVPPYSLQFLQIKEVKLAKLHDFEQFQFLSPFIFRHLYSQLTQPS